MIRSRLPAVLVSAALLAGCVETVPVQTGSGSPAPAPVSSSTAARNFAAVVRRVEPVAERECRARAPRLDCDFRIVVDDRPNQPSNAYQTVDDAGRPVIAFTLALIAEARNQDELAFIMGHEAGHHIAGHLNRTRQTAVLGALIFGTLASAAGVENVGTAQDIGATVGARTYSKDYELEADALGTIIAFRAGYDPARGAAFFDRIPDPGNRFLGTHPPNASRRATVEQTLATLR
jgi:Zn-dependent protease with chaperone function